MGSKKKNKDYFGLNAHAYELTQGLNEENLNEVDLKKYMGRAKKGWGEFIGALKQESKETKEAFKLLTQSVKGEKILSSEEKKEIGNQLKDVFKTIGYVGLFALPGGSLFAILFNLLKLNKYILPSAFQKKDLDEAIVGDKIECDNCDWSWDIVSGGDDLFVCHKCGHNNEPVNEKKDPFGLNQFARELIGEGDFDAFDYPIHIKSLTQFMLDIGFNINPLPKVKFIDDDAPNSSKFLGTTAYYDPEHNKIVLYTMGRHPKDVMRSFAHEMIHHMQNCENRLGSITTQNTTKDSHLDAIEREAYEKGNITFRNWTDTIKNI